VASKDIGNEVGFSDEIRDDIESWLAGAKLIEFVALGPMVTLTDAGRSWAEAGASLEKPPAGSNAIVTDLGEGAQVGTIQAAGHRSQQTADAQQVVVDLTAAVREWAESVRELLGQVTERDQGYIEAHLEEVDEALQDNETGRLRRAVSKVLDGVRKMGWSASGDVTAMAVVMQGEHLLHLIH
jgi:hypothetical protein